MLRVCPVIPANPARHLARLDYPQRPYSPVPPSELRRRPHRRHVLIRGLKPITALRTNQKVLFQALDLRRWQGPHGVVFEIVFGDVLHDFHGSLFPGGIEGGEADLATSICLPDFQRRLSK